MVWPYEKEEEITFWNFQYGQEFKSLWRPQDAQVTQVMLCCCSVFTALIEISLINRSQLHLVLHI